MAKYGLNEICRDMLDNADMTLDLSSYPHIRMHFVVFGSVDGAFYEVIFQCDETISLNIENDNNANSQDLNLVLEVNLIEKAMETAAHDVSWRFENQGTVWHLKIYGDMPLELVCCKFDWQLNELTPEQYHRKYA